MVEQKTAPRRKTRRERFISVATRRTTKVLQALAQLSKCSNRSVYEYSDKDVSKIFAAIETELNRAKGGFSTQQKATFSLLGDEEGGEDAVR